MSREVRMVEQSGADLLHIDIMDGSFVPNITFGPMIVSAIRKETKLPLDIHLMINRPERHIKSFIDAGGDIITVHVEACRGNVDSLISMINDFEKMAGVALKPNTPISKITHLLPSLQMVTLMSVNPGFAGQAFNPKIIPKIEALSRIRSEKGYNFDIEVDGGITPQTAIAVKNAGATILVAGTAVFGQPDIRKAIKNLRDSVAK